jgi:hypothetical protein
MGTRIERIKWITTDFLSVNLSVQSAFARVIQDDMAFARTGTLKY